MRKKIFTLSLFALIFNQVSAQEKNISFEETEGYSTGYLVGQNTWESYGYITEGYANVSNNKYSDGNLSAQLIADPANEGNWGGIVYKLPEAKKFIISTDVNMEELYGSDHDLLSIYDNTNGEYEYISGFYFDFLGDIIIGDETTSQSSGNWEPNTWYNLKADYDFNTRKIDLYLNNNHIRTVAIPSQIQKVTEVDFEFDNYSGFNVDNIKIVNLDHLSNNEVSINTISIYPNPTSDWLKVNSVTNIKSLEIIDFNGNSILRKENTTEMNVKELSNGIYFIKVYT
ncbi:MAG: T9SS type A sorting domain-containing protein, partial [Flavobacteriaceae bacterium]|nr:T9SS type A sorting domain-containing protein [Candidatus Onthonaster equi]